MKKREDRTCAVCALCVCVRECSHYSQLSGGMVHALERARGACWAGALAAQALTLAAYLALR